MRRKSKSKITNTNANGEGDFYRGGFSIRGILSRVIFHSVDFVAGDFPFGGVCRGGFGRVTCILMENKFMFTNIFSTFPLRISNEF